MIRSITRTIAAAGAAALLVGTLAGPAAANAPARTPGLRVGVGNNYSGQLLVALRAVDGTVQVRRLTKNTGVFMSLGGNITGGPWVFVRGTDGALWQRSLSTAWEKIGGSITSAPSVAPASGGACPGIKNVVALGTDSAVWRWTGGAWSKIGGSSAYAPTILRRGGVTYVFVVAPTERST